jgi:hypothetical protein
VGRKVLLVTAFVNNCFKLLPILLALLVKPVPGLGQQPAAPTLESLVAAAQQAQAAHDYAAAEKLTASGKD